MRESNMEKFKLTPKKKEEAEKENRLEEPKKPWLDIYGDTLIKFEGDTIRITERKSGEVTERKLEKPDDPFYSLSREEQQKVMKRLKEYEESGELKHLPPSEQQEAIAEERRKISREMLEG